MPFPLVPARGGRHEGAPRARQDSARPALGGDLAGDRARIELLLGQNQAVADYPMGDSTKPSGSWFRLGFPSGYVTDVLQVLEALCEAGAAGDPRLGPALDWLLAQQDEQGRWANRYAYQGKMVVDIDRAGQPSKWVTLRACRVLKAVAEARGGARGG